MSINLSNLNFQYFTEEELRAVPVDDCYVSEDGTHYRKWDDAWGRVLGTDAGLPPVSKRVAMDNDTQIESLCQKKLCRVGRFE